MLPSLVDCVGYEGKLQNRSPYSIWQVRAYLVRQYHAKVEKQYQWTEGDVEWDERNTVVYPLICSLAGLVAGMFGVGGCAAACMHACPPMLLIALAEAVHKK